MKSAIRPLTAAPLGLAAALLVSCGSSGAGLIPAASAGPLQRDFEAVEQAAQSGNGQCGETEAAIRSTERHFLLLPPSVDHGLRETLKKGIENLRAISLAQCAQSTSGSTETVGTQTTSTTSTQTSTQTGTSTPTTTSTTTSTTGTPTTSSTATETGTSTTSAPTTGTGGAGGGTPAPGAGAQGAGGGGGGAAPGDGGGSAGEGGAHGGGQ
ncbi:MAG TPA: hypothetical protein VGX16_00605 [Solirubrobacteraceae bacterium]|jgi:hypothetical protein|nr:hypothetical protein [Solirubrobacteraceae bacterium]